MHVQHENLSILRQAFGHGTLQTLVYMLLCFAAPSGQYQKYVNQSELWAVLGCVAAAVDASALLHCGKHRSQNG